MLGFGSFVKRLTKNRPKSMKKKQFFQVENFFFHTSYYQNRWNKIEFWSCLNVFQVVLNHINWYKKPLGIWSLGVKIRFFDDFSLSGRIFYRCRNFYLNFLFLKSSHHRLHFSYLSYVLKMDTYGATCFWSHM